MDIGATKDRSMDDAGDGSANSASKGSSGGTIQDDGDVHTWTHGRLFTLHRPVKECVLPDGDPWKDPPTHPASKAPGKA